MKRAACLLAIAAWWTAIGLSASRITLSHKDPRHSNSDLVDRDWGTQLRNFGNTGQGSEIYVGAGDLSFAGNRKVADMIWNATPSGLNTFTFAYTPSPARFTVTAAGATTASQFYDFQTPTANPNQVFNALLIQLEAKGNDEVVITNLALTITGGATTNLGTIQVAQGQEIFGLIDDVAGAYTSGFTLTGNIVYPAVLHTPKEEDPRIRFFALYDRSQPVPADLTLSKSHTGNFTQGQTAATYTLTASNIGGGPTAGTVTVVDNFPPELIPTAAAGSGWTCSISTNSSACSRSDALGAGASYPPITLTVNVAATAPPMVNNAAAITGGNDGNSANNTVLDPTAIIRGPDLSITKTATGSFTQGQMGAGYTLAVANAGGVGTSGVVTVTDSLPAGLAPATVSGPGWTCGISGNTTTCNRSDPLAPGGSYPPISLTVNVASNAPPSVTNQATVGGGGDLNASNNTAIATTSIARTSDLTITKSHTGNFTQGQEIASYTVTVTNVGGAPTNASVLVSDTMGLPLIPRSGSGDGWSCDTLSTAIRCQRSDALAPGASYPPITMTASIAADAPPTVTNVVSVSGGGEGNASNNSASDVATVLPAADLSITKSHAGNFIQGQPGTYTLTITNTGATATSGSVTVVDHLPGGLAPTTASGTGWTCGIAGQSVSCTRNDVMTAGQSYPAITLTVSVERNAPASVTNSASVFGGGDANTSNNTATDPTTITPGANLTITKSHTGNFTQGQTGSYTLTVSNVGGAPTLNPVIVTDSLPPGLAASAAAGTGWSCTAGPQSLTCERSDVLNPGAAYPPITLTVDVAPNAPASVTNTAQVSAGSDVDSGNNMASDPTTVVVVPDLTVTKTHTGSFLQGQVGATYSLTVANVGSGPTSSPVTLSDSLPPGLTPTAAAGAGWVCNIAGQTVSCPRGDALTGGASYPAITLTVNVAPAAPPTLTNTAIVSGGGEVNTSNNTADDITTIGPGIDLTVTKSHSGDFRQGQIGATFTITVSNPGSPTSTGIVTVTDNVPTGLLPASASGAGWICSISGQDVTCTRSDPLPSGQSYPAITVTVNVQSPATGSVTNFVGVSGGGDVNLTNNSALDIILIVPGADLTITKTHTGNFTQGLTGTYTVTVTNTGVGPTTSAVTVLDPVPLGLTPTAAVGAGWSCTVGSQGVSCQRSDALAAGAGYPPIAITVNVAPDAPPTLTNTASVAGGGDGNSANNTASDATTILPGANTTVMKTHTGTFTQGQKGATYTITVGNSGGSPTSGEITVVDVLPVGVVPSAATGSGWTCDVDGRAVTCRRSDPLGLGTSYPPITLTVDVGPNAPASLTNTATVSGGGDVDSADNTATDVTVIASGPDMMVTKTHTGSFFQGQTGATYTIAVTNQGGSPSSGTVRVTDDMSGRFQPTAATGVGWTCTVAGEVVQCERADPLALGASYPIITITVNVPTTALPSVTNTADVSGGGDVNAGNNTAADVTTISPGPDLAVSKSHTVRVTQGQTAAGPGFDYSLLVSNVGGVTTADVVTLIDSVPTGLIPVAAAGSGWSCSIALQSVTCTRADTLAAGASYPAVTLTVDVEPGAPASVVNTATIAGGGDINSSNNTVSDPTAINRGQNLTISKSHNAGFTQGQRGATYTIVVTNVGEAPTLGTVAVIDAVPDGLFPTAASGAGWNCSVSGQTSNCSRGDALGAGASYEPVTITVDVAADAPASITNRAIVTGGGDVLSSDNTAEDLTVVETGPDLTLVKSHANRVGPGQIVIFTLTATNSGGAPTEGLVNLVDNLPVGLSATRASGAGWTCEILDLVVACSRSDALAPGASYPPLMISAGVARDVPIGSSLVNSATISRGGEVKLDNNTAEDVVVISRGSMCDVNGDGFDDIVTSAGPGGGPHVNVWTLATGAVTNLASFYAYDPAFGGGAFVGCADLDGDGLGDVVTGAGAGGGPHVRAFSLATGYAVEIASFFAYDPAFSGGVRVAAGDVDGDGRAEIITGAGPLGGPHVRAFRLVGSTPVEIASFYAYDPAFTGGVFVAAGDVTGDGRAAIITGTYQFGGPVRVFTLGPGGVAEHAYFPAYFSGFSGPVRVATADINGDGVAEIITGAGPGGGPHVRAFGVVGGVLTDFASFYAYDPPFCDIGMLFPDPVVCDGVYVGGGDVNGDGIAEVITGTNRQGGPLRIFRIGAGVTELTSFFPYFEAFRGPVYVAALAPGRGGEPFDRPGPPSDSTLPMNVDSRRVDTEAGSARVVFSSQHVDGRERSPPCPQVLNLSGRNPRRILRVA